jgi:hypothetical protein
MSRLEPDSFTWFETMVDNMNAKAIQKQVGGNHYKDCPIQPIEYIIGNSLGWCEGNIVKYITRHHMKGGRADVEKVIHYAQLLLELEYPED